MVLGFRAVSVLVNKLSDNSCGIVKIGKAFIADSFESSSLPSFYTCRFAESTLFINKMRIKKDLHKAGLFLIV